MNLIEGYLRETPSKLGEIVTGTPALFEAVSGKKYDRIVVTGSGTSFHSGAQMRSYMQRVLSADVLALYPFQITKELFAPQNGKTLLIGISQGGSSFSTYNAMKLARACGAETASMAGAEGAFIDEVADFVLTVRCGEEKAGAKTKGYYCTKLNLMLMALYMAVAQKKVDDAYFQAQIGNVHDACDRFMRVYEQSERWVERNAQKFAAAREIRVVGPAGLYGDVLEGALKLLETMRCPVSGYEFEEFIHGVYNAVNEDSTIFVLDAGGEERVKKLVEVLSGWTEHVHVVGREAARGENDLQADICADEDGRTFNFLLPLQLVCAKIPQLRGVDPSTPKDPQFHMKLGSKRFNK